MIETNDVLKFVPTKDDIFFRHPKGGFLVSVSLDSSQIFLTEDKNLTVNLDLNSAGNFYSFDEVHARFEKGGEDSSRPDRLSRLYFLLPLKGDFLREDYLRSYIYILKLKPSEGQSPFEKFSISA